MSVDNRKDAVLVLLDLSAAFDTIDHDILIQRLNVRYGITESALNWFNTYLRGRQQVIKIGNVRSEPRKLLCGVPQGSVVGPQIFSLYVAPIEDIVGRYQIDGMYYADDTQLYVDFNRYSAETSLHQLEMCVKDIKNWMATNKLALNETKTEAVHISSRFSKSVRVPSITVGSSVVNTLPKAKDLGVIIDQELFLTPHVNNLCRSAYLAIRNISRIRKYLDRESTEILVHAFVSSKLDLMNSILYGLPKFQLNKLQRIQNSAARLVTLTKKYVHITPIMRELHWLPVEQRIKYKILLLTFKSLNGLAPTYIMDLISIKEHTRNLRSNAFITLNVQSANTISYGSRAFSRAAPQLWNRLPAHLKTNKSIEQFKRQLKTYLFCD